MWAVPNSGLHTLNPKILRSQTTQGNLDLLPSRSASPSRDSRGGCRYASYVLPQKIAAFAARQQAALCYILYVPAVGSA